MSRMLTMCWILAYAPIHSTVKVPNLVPLHSEERINTQSDTNVRSTARRFGVHPDDHRGAEDRTKDFSTSIVSTCTDKVVPQSMPPTNTNTDTNVVVTHRT